VAAPVISLECTIPGRRGEVRVSVEDERKGGGQETKMEEG